MARFVVALPELCELQALACVIDNLADCIDRASDGLEGQASGVDETGYVEKQVDHAQRHVGVLKSKLMGVLREMMVALARTL